MHVVVGEGGGWGWGVKGSQVTSGVEWLLEVLRETPLSLVVSLCN